MSQLRSVEGAGDPAQAGRSGARRSFLPLLLLFSAAAIYLPLPFLGRTLTTDDCIYAWIGRNIVTGHGISDWQGAHTMFPPGYPFLIGLAYLLLGDLELSCRIAVVIASLGFLLLIRDAAEHTCGRRVATLASCLAAFCPGLISLAYNGGSEVPFALLTCAAIYAAALALSGSVQSAFWTGAATGLAYLIRPEALLFAPVFLLFILIAGAARRPPAIALFLFALGVCVLPYSVFLRANTGHWTLSGKSKTLVVDNPSVTSSPEKALYTLDSSGKAYSGDAIRTARAARGAALSPINYARNFKRMLGASVRMVGLPACILAAWGVMWCIRRKKMPLGLTAACLPVLLVLAIPAFFIRERYLAGAIPMALIWATYGASLGMSSPRSIVRRLTVALICASVVLGMVNLSRELRSPDDPTEQKLAGLALHQISLSGEGVMSRKPWTPFYADRPWVITPLTDYAGVIRFARERQARYIVVDERYTAKLRPSLRFLMDPAKAPKGLRPVLRVERTPEGRRLPALLVYEVLPEAPRPQTPSRSPRD